jgi:hypothetical protein
MLNKLKEYLKSAQISEIRKEWEEIVNEFPNGVCANEYIQYSKKTYKVVIPPLLEIPNLNLSSNLTSNFSGSFFLV